MSWFTKARDAVENVAAAPANILSFGQAEKLTSTGAQNSGFGKASVKIAKGVDIAGALAVGGYYAAPYLASAGSSLLTGAKAVGGTLLAGFAKPQSPAAPAATADFTRSIQPGDYMTPVPTAPAPAAAAPGKITATHVAIGVGVVGVGLELVKMLKR